VAHSKCVAQNVLRMSSTPTPGWEPLAYSK